MGGIDRTKPEDMKPIDKAAHLCWGSGRGDLYDAIHATKKDNERLRDALVAAKACINDKAYTAAVMVIDTALQQKDSE